MNRAEEDYIKTIYELTAEKKQPLIKSNEIADRFGFTDQSVNEMIKKLEKKGLVSFIPYKGISLTRKGKDVAIRMVRAHRIWEVFLTEKLGFSWENVHEDAEMLEHATSREVLEKLYTFLGEPKYCQHGNPIPDFRGKIGDSTAFSLCEVKVNQSFELLRVNDHKDLLVYLNQNNMKLHDCYQVLEKDEFNGLIKIRNKQDDIVLTLKTAGMLFGKIVEDK
ncbi:MAG: metal-dependent transcriptional regulator [Acholeplasmataceae bacterium]|jgi:DtxR family Mn-dependent transcriptional regulator|nr:metal-dependent transcriptional regulator [Acholeplasmataceae bacterium]